MNPLVGLWSQKQSFWLDFIRRSLLTSGELKKLIERDGLRGMTSNPSIFEKAISAGEEYDAELKRWAEKGLSNEEIFEAIAMVDIQKAADLLKPVYKSSGGTDGFVSLEVNPNLAHDTAGTIEEALWLVKKINRPNLMVKVPGTPAGLPAIEALVAAGVNVNITLLFSVEVYKKVLDAYLRGLDQRVKKKLPINRVASVASFFVSRVDTIIDKELDQLVAKGNDKAASLLHKAAIANAKLAYAYYETVIKSPQFEKLRKKGAQVQRLLWASTSSKDKRLPDVVYVDELIGPDTVNTMPPQTVDAFRDHGSVQVRLTLGLADARSSIEEIKALGVNFEGALQQLQEDGVKLFQDSFEALLKSIGAKRELLTGYYKERMAFHLQSYVAPWKSALDIAEKDKWASRIWSKDAVLWKSEPDHQMIIKNSLGWLTVVSRVKANLKYLSTMADDVRKAKFTHALLLGMGGSSLCPEVLRLTFGKKHGYPDLSILDSTEPASVLERAARSKPEKTLYIVASKSGTTSEPNAFLAAFYDRLKKKKAAKAGQNFIAITDPGTLMERLAREKKFRHVVLNPSDIGGRYSALSYFGMLPAALMGHPVKEILDSASQMAYACTDQLPALLNPAMQLGLALGSLAKAGRDRVTFFLSKEIASFSTWVEQLIAESTGKEGKGILPVESEPIQPPDLYGTDRVFVSIRLGKTPAGLAKKLSALKGAGHPVIEIRLDRKSDIGAEFFRWEFATAVAGALLGIDAFDQPNVQESKDLTKKYLNEFRERKELPLPNAKIMEDGVSLYSRNGVGQANSLEESLERLFKEIKSGDYVALLAYLERNQKNTTLLQSIRDAILKSKKVATTLGFGPRFLHSTGQLHKGGPNNGVFIQITADDVKDWAIPGEPFSFSVLKDAQALGDLTALENKHRRVIRIHLENSTAGLNKLKDLIQRVVSN